MSADSELIERANRGDAIAFEQLYERHRAWVLRLARRFTQSDDDAHDVLQETFAYFFRKFPGFVLTAALTTFLYPVVKHVALDLRRKQRPAADVDELAEVLPAPAVSETASDAERLLAALPPLHREIAYLRFVDDLSLPQIAETLGIPIGTVKSRLHHAVAALRKANGI